jgi:hypothetical protein
MVIGTGLGGAGAKTGCGGTTFITGFGTSVIVAGGGWIAGCSCNLSCSTLSSAGTSFVGCAFCALNDSNGSVRTAIAMDKLVKDGFRIEVPQ